MSLMTLERGVNDLEDPALAPVGTLLEAIGAEYRPNDRGLWVARGRTSMMAASVTVDSPSALYYLQFDGGRKNVLVFNSVTVNDFSLAGSTLTPIGAGITTPAGSTGSLYASLVQFGNRFFTTRGGTPFCLEDSALPSANALSLGFVAPTLAPTLVVAGGAGSMTCTAGGLKYWYTFYDPSRGWESTASPVSASTGNFTSKASVTVTRTSSPAGIDSLYATKWRLYRSNDGGAFPDGGFIAEVDIATTTFVDTNAVVTLLVRPFYATVSVGDFPTDQDAQPPALRWLCSYDGQLIGATVADPRSIRASAFGLPQSWPALYELPIEPPRNDASTCGVQVGRFLLIFYSDFIYRCNGFDLTGSPASTIEPLTMERGTFGPNTIAKFHLGETEVVAFVARDGVWATDGVGMFELTAGGEWFGSVDVTKLGSSSLVYDAENRRLVFSYMKLGGLSGVSYLTVYGGAIRSTDPDHGTIISACNAIVNGRSRIISIATDPTTSQRSFYLEAEGILDASHFRNADGRVYFRATTNDIFPGGPGVKQRLKWLNLHHSKPSGSPTPTIRVNHDPEALDSIGQPSSVAVFLRNWSTRGSDRVSIAQDVESFAVQVESDAPVSFRLDWLATNLDIQDQLVGKGA